MYIILAYDIQDNNVRDEVRDFLKKYLYHVQKSVFEGYISNKELNFVIKEILKKLYEGDKLLVIILDHKNFKKIELGKKKEANIL